MDGRGHINTAHRHARKRVCVCVSVCLCVCLSVCLSVFVHMFMYVHVCRLSGSVVMLVGAFVSKVFWISTGECFDVVCIVCD